MDSKNGFWLILALVVAGFVLVYNMIKQQDAVTNAELSSIANQNKGGGLLGAIGSLFGL